jgi:Tol biopolymer transport system component
MNKRHYVILLFIAIVSIFFFYKSINATDGAIKKLTGNIEIVSDFGIKRIYYPSRHIESVFPKQLNYLIHSFDLSKKSKNRILAVSGAGNKPERLVMLLNNGSLYNVLSKNFVRHPSFSPVDERIGYITSKPTNNKEKAWFSDWYLHIINTDGSDNRQVSKISNSNCKPSWFPDGKKLVVGSKDLNIYILDINNGKEQKIISFGTCPTISNNGKWIAYLSNDVSETTRKRIIQHTKITETEYENIQEEKGKRQEELSEIELYFIKHSIYLYNIETGVTKKLSKELWVEQAPIWSPDDKYLLFNTREYVANEIYIINIETGKKDKISSENGRIMVWNDSP